MLGWSLNSELESIWTAAIVGYCLRIGLEKLTDPTGILNRDSRYPSRDSNLLNTSLECSLYTNILGRENLRTYTTTSLRDTECTRLSSLVHSYPAVGPSVHPSTYHHYQHCRHCFFRLSTHPSHNSICVIPSFIHLSSHQRHFSFVHPPTIQSSWLTRSSFFHQPTNNSTAFVLSLCSVIKFVCIWYNSELFLI